MLCIVQVSIFHGADPKILNWLCTHRFESTAQKLDALLTLCRYISFDLGALPRLEQTNFLPKSDLDLPSVQSSHKESTGSFHTSEILSEIS